MKIAVLSGKGGTGKTTVSTSLASALKRCQYIDCDVEEPNGAIFMKPELETSFPVKVKIPQVDAKKCNSCGDCGEACQFNAIAVISGTVLIFPEVCHHCGACTIACSQEAIFEIDRTIGIVETNKDETFLHGKLNIGEPINIPIISELKKRIKKDMPVILDCPPGASCSVVEAIEGCDYCILVAEPTPFGLHDLKIVVQLVKKMNIPFGVVINKADESRNIHDFCKENQIEILMEIPYSQEIARAYSKGFLPVKFVEWKNIFAKLYEKAVRGATQ